MSFISSIFLRFPIRTVTFFFILFMLATNIALGVLVCCCPDTFVLPWKRIASNRTRSSRDQISVEEMHGIAEHLRATLTGTIPKICNKPVILLAVEVKLLRVTLQKFQFLTQLCSPHTLQHTLSPKRVVRGQ